MGEDEIVLPPNIVDSGKPGGAWEDNVNHPSNKRLLWTGRIVHVDSETMVCSVALETGGGGICFLVKNHYNIWRT